MNKKVYVYIFSIGFVFCYLIYDIKYYLKHSIQDQFESPIKLQENKENRNIENITYENYRYQSDNENNAKANLFLIENFGLNKETINKGLNFDINKNALAFMHIQKTSGKEFDKKFSADLMVKHNGQWIRACKERNDGRRGLKAYDCNLGGKTDWYLSRGTNGWPCGIHPFYSQIKKCYPQVVKKYKGHDIFVFTMLRNPIIRYLSEWYHISRVGK